MNALNWQVQVNDETGAVFVKPVPGQIVCEVDAGPQQMENAALIAAAPGLRDAATATVHGLQAEWPSIVGRDDDFIYDTIGSALAAAYFAARDALAKARP